MYNQELFDNTTLIADATSILFNCANLAAVGLEIKGTWSATLLFEYTIDGAVWHSMQDLITKLTQATANGSFVFDVSAYKAIRVRCHPYTSGTPNIFFYGKSTPTTLGINNENVVPGTPVNAVAATVTLTSDNTDVADGDTVTIGSTVYRFKNTIAQVNDIHRTGTADTTLTNLVNAINGAGTAGTDYFTGTPVNPDVSAGAVSSHATVLTAKTKGAAANSLASTETSAHLSFNHATLTGGVDGTPANAGTLYYDSSYIYTTPVANTISGANWLRFGPGASF